MQFSEKDHFKGKISNSPSPTRQKAGHDVPGKTWHPPNYTRGIAWCMYNYTKLSIPGVLQFLNLTLINSQKLFHY